MPRIRRYRRAVLVATASLLAALSSPGTALATDRTFEFEPLDAAESLLLDAESYAAEFQVTVDEAERRLALQSELNILIDGIEQVAAEDYAGGWIQHNPDYRVVIRLTSRAVPVPVSQLVQSSPTPVDVELDAPAALESLREKQHLLVGGLPSSLKPTSTDIDYGRASLL